MSFNHQERPQPISKKKRAKRNTACHHCRKNHISCDGHRPCANCVKRERTCFDYDRLLHNIGSDPSCQSEHSRGETKIKIIQESIPNLYASSSSSRRKVNNVAEIERLQVELEEMKKRLFMSHQVIHQLQEEKRLNEERERRSEEEEEALHLVNPRSEFSVDLWNEPLDLRKNIIIYESTTFRIIGCNSSVSKLLRYSKQQLKSMQNIFSIVPQANREMWRSVVQWVSVSGVNQLIGNAVVELPDGSTSFYKTVNNFHRSFVVVEFCDATSVTDEYVVDNVIIQPSAMLQGASNLERGLPMDSFGRLLQYLRDRRQKSVYSDQSRSQEVLINNMFLNHQQYLMNNSNNNNNNASTTIIEEEDSEDKVEQTRQIIDLLDNYSANTFPTL